MCELAIPGRIPTVKVLIADDSTAIRTMLGRCLQAWGHEIVEAADGEQAWQILCGEDPPRVAILDWVMPALEGVEVCRRVRQRLPKPFVYTILLTSKHQEDDLVQALEAGAHIFLSKPIMPEVLRSHVNVGERLVEADDTLQEYANRMEILATTDALTGISNRRQFFESGTRELLRARRHRRPLSLLLMDFDHFKQVNDTHGHAVGDEVLRTVTLHCQRILRQEDIFGRLGGEEFGVLLVEVASQGARDAGERLRKLVEELSIETQSGTLQITMSVGVATREDPDRSLDDLLRRADLALYEAKRSGRNRVVGPPVAV
jgi:diguanylate cyclase (GGDEF)-like protein